MARRISLLGLALLALVGCGRHRPTTWLTVAPATSAAPTTATPSPPTSATPAPPTSSAPVPPAGVLRVLATGPGPARIAPGAREVTALALELTNLTAEPLEVRGLELVATGRLDDAASVLTARLAEDRDQDGRFDRAIDRVVASAGFQRDDGPLAFAPLRLPLAPGATMRALVVLDLGAPAVAGDDLRLAPTGATALAASGAPAAVELRGAGPRLSLGAWVEPHEAFALVGEALFPRAAVDAQGRTHVGVFMNNGRSTVHYTVFDGRRWSAPDEVSRSASSTAWNQDLAVDAAGLPSLAWEEWEGGPADVAIRWSAFDPVAFTWPPSERVCPPGPGLRQAPRLIATGSGAARVVDAAWEQHDLLTGEIRVHHRRRTASGWGAIAEVSSAAANVSRAEAPALAALPGGALLFAWVEGGAGSEVRARRLEPTGAWSPVETIARAVGLAGRPALLVEGSTVHCAFQDGDEVLIARRDASGWSAAVNVSATPGTISREPALALHQGALHLAWVEGSERVAVAAAQGGGFGPPLVLTRGAGARSRPTFASEGTRLRLLWQDRSLNRQRVYESWLEPLPLEAPRALAAPGGDPQKPALAAGPAGELLAAFALDAGGNAEVFAGVEDAAGGIAAFENVSRSPSGSHQPAIAAVGTRALVVWEEDGPGGFELRFATKDSAGWTTPAPVASGLTPAYTPRLASGPDGALLVFTARAAGGDHDLFQARFDGRAWSAPAALAPDPSGSSWSPALARRADGVAAVAWEEERAGRREVRAALLDPSGALSIAPVPSAAASQWAPRLAWDGDALHLAWVEDGRVKVARRPAGQAAFDAPVELSSGGSWIPVLAAANGAVLLAFEQWTNGDSRVLASELGPNGWGPTAPLDFSSGPARAPALSGSPTGGLRAVWVEPGKLVERLRRER